MTRATTSDGVFVYTQRAGGISVSLAPPPDVGEALKALQLADAGRAIDTAAATLANQLRAWMARAVRRELAEAQRDPTAYLRRRTKQERETRGPLDELREMLLRFGLARAEASGRAAAATRGGTLLLPGSLLADAIAGKPVRIRFFQELVDGLERRAVELNAELAERVRESVRVVVAEANAQPTRATVGDITRRIARTVHAVEPAEGPAQGKVYAFSFARAEVIARTEMVQVENSGRMAGYEATGVETVEWLAYATGSGDRHHELMRGQTVPLGEPFTMPDGASMRFPGDPLGPIGHTANCRCTTRPGRAKKS